MEGSE
jgi:hypothetical protein